MIMIRNNRIKIIITSIVILIPMLAGLILWESLPLEIAVHWNVSIEPDNFMSKAFAVFGSPAIFLGVHLVGIFVTAFDKKNKGKNGKMFGIFLWICPCLSLLCNALIFAHGLGAEPNVGFWVLIFAGIIFIIIGNYLPKCTLNHTIGIKLPWTLGNEEVWNKTHRLGGILWVISGVLILITAFLPSSIMRISFIIILVLAVVIPTLYSYVIYRKTRS